MVISRSWLVNTGQPECHEYGRSALVTSRTVAENFGGPVRVGEGAGVGSGAGVAEGEGAGVTAASAWKAPDVDVATLVPPQAVNPRTAAAATADLGFHLDGIRAEYLCAASREADSRVGAPAS
ncbi:hypothetical protein Pth03_46460 [Planotetraspora thailandica]|uniref:Uncharacterized protein n=1 Tax=Planotetraspora thailandica TaxID=487172 RepID=A0A8J3XV80_9ACTN|nr:hypothetical protein Pth03_46460 [Planotetraspora thailandica]